MGSHFVPLFLRDRILDIESKEIALNGTNRLVELSVPNWLLDFGIFILSKETTASNLNQEFRAAKVQYLPLTPKASTEYVLTDGVNSIKASTSNEANTNELVEALKQADNYNSLLFTIQSDASNGQIKLIYKNNAPQEYTATLRAGNEKPIEVLNNDLRVVQLSPQELSEL